MTRQRFRRGTSVFDPIHLARASRALGGLLVALLLAGGSDAMQSGLRTRWAEDVSAELPLPEYPRPQLVREQWQNVNGPWDYAVSAKDAPAPDQWEGKI